MDLIELSGSTFFLLAACIAVLLVVRARSLFSSRQRNPSRLPLPPGPKALPIVGNLLDFPRTSQWLVFAEWARQFGDVVSIDLMGTRMIFLNTLQGTTDLMEKRSATYSDRPRMPMVVELIGIDWALPAMPYGEKWRVARRAFHQYFNAQAVEDFFQIQTKVTRRLLKGYLGTPEKFREHMQLAMVASAIEIAYGFEVTNHDVKYVAMAEEVMEALDAAAMPGGFLVDLLPILKYVPSWMPGAGFQVKARRWRKAAYEFFTVPYKDARVAMNDSVHLTSIVARMTTAGMDKYGSDESLIPGIAAMTYIAGSDTISSVLETFMLAMTLFPEAQKEGQRVLDEYLAQNRRLPEFSDRPSLPYIEALMKETLRWKPIVPLAVPHLATEDDEYNGYFIPKGSVVLGNVWSITQNPEHYPDPMNYKPERFLLDGEINPDILDPDLAFGFGRRKCPGRFLAMNQLWISIASILTCFDISPPLDEDGRPITVEVRMKTHLTHSPKPFECRITPRSKEAADLVNAY